MYDAAGTELRRSVDPETGWYESVLHENTRFVGMVQVYRDEAATTLKANVIVSYSVHIDFLKFSSQYHRFLIDLEHRLLTLLPVSTSKVCHESDFGEPKRE